MDYSLFRDYIIDELDDTSVDESHLEATLRVLWRQCDGEVNSKKDYLIADMFITGYRCRDNLKK